MWREESTSIEQSGPCTLVTSAPNGFVQEVALAFYHGWHTDYFVDLPTLDAGAMRPLESAGLEIELNPELVKAADTRLRRMER